MIPSNDGGSRWPLLAEMILCFMPLSIASCAFVADWVAAPRGPSLFALIALLSVVGPIGLMSTIMLILRRRSISHVLGAVLVIGPLLLSIAIFVAFGRSELTALSVLRDIVLIGVLPAFAGFHMLLIGRRTPAIPAMQ